MPDPDALLAAAVRAAPRRYRLPPLPPDAAAARALGADGALAFAIESLRQARQRHQDAPTGTAPLFTEALSQRIRLALDPQRGDPAFQALLLRTQDAEAGEHVRLAAHSASDRRALRTRVDAIAHPGKLRGAHAERDALLRLHALAVAGDWAALREAARDLRDRSDDATLREAAAAIASDAALARLERAAALAASPSVQRYLALCERSGPRAGSDAATARGRAAARRGDAAEDETVRAFAAIARQLDALAAGAGRHRVLRSLRTPRGHPGEAMQAKEEWDAALVREQGGAADILLLAEAKASPAAATPDLARLRRGLQRLAQADADAVVTFPSADGPLAVHGRSLRALAPQGDALPPHVVYTCTAPPEAEPPLLAAASRAVLLAEPASLAYAARLQAGHDPGHGVLLPVWEALASAPRLRATLHQDDTARQVRAAMLHPQDLLAAWSRALQGAA